MVVVEGGAAPSRPLVYGARRRGREKLVKSYSVEEIIDLTAEEEDFVDLTEEPPHLERKRPRDDEEDYEPDKRSRTAGLRFKLSRMKLRAGDVDMRAMTFCFLNLCNSFPKEVMYKTQITSEELGQIMLAKTKVL